jgi:hypothetical protein
VLEWMLLKETRQMQEIMFSISIFLGTTSSVELFKYASDLESGIVVRDYKNMIK